jgi:hypothetical protein
MKKEYVSAKAGMMSPVYRKDHISCLRPHVCDPGAMTFAPAERPLMMLVEGWLVGCPEGCVLGCLLGCLVGEPDG